MPPPPRAADDVLGFVRLKAEGCAGTLHRTVHMYYDACRRRYISERQQAVVGQLMACGASSEFESRYMIRAVSGVVTHISSLLAVDRSIYCLLYMSYVVVVIVLAFTSIVAVLLIGTS
eukprot:scaffold28535_cov31-Prasinocladus_malaysianus.AAC.1